MKPCVTELERKLMARLSSAAEVDYLPELIGWRLKSFICNYLQRFCRTENS